MLSSSDFQGLNALGYVSLLLSILQLSYRRVFGVNWSKGITQQVLLGRIVLWGNQDQIVLQILPVIKIHTAPLSHQKI